MPIAGQRLVLLIKRMYFSRRIPRKQRVEHSLKEDLPKAACGAGGHMLLAARVFISRREDARGGGMGRFLLAGWLA